MSFYVTLPSNSSMEIFPGNTQSNYTTLLQNPIQLDGPYEVALSEISYSSDFNVELGNLVIDNPFYVAYEVGSQKVNIRIAVNNSLKNSDLCNTINKEIENQIIVNEYNRIFNRLSGLNKKFSKSSKVIEIIITKNNLIIPDTADSVNKEIYEKNNGIYDNTLSLWLFDKTAEELPNEIKNRYITTVPKTSYGLNYDLTAFEAIKATYNLLKGNVIPTFKVIENDSISVEFKKESKVGFTGLLDNIFRNERDVLYTQRTFRIPENIKLINYVLIYTDIIQEQFYGDKLTTNLRTITVHSNLSGDVSTFYENPHYVPVAKTRINTINIQITDLYGNLIHFKDFFSYVIIKLHFRKNELE